MAKYKVGDRVRIVDEWGEGCNQNLEGLMDGWLGKVMTIRDTYLFGNYFNYFMEEDEGEWAWNDSCIVGLADCEKAEQQKGVQDTDRVLHEILYNNANIKKKLIELGELTDSLVRQALQLRLEVDDGTEN